jgi:hypothetical protein
MERCCVQYILTAGCLLCHADSCDLRGRIVERGLGRDEKIKASTAIK